MLLLAVIIPVGTPYAAPPAANDLPEPTEPNISESGRAFLSRVARRTLADALLGRETYEAAYVPRSLGSETAAVAVRLWHHGYLRATGVGPRGPIVQATRDAALAAAQMLGAGRVEVGELPDRLLIEIEAAGPDQPIPGGIDWTRPGSVDRYFEPGIDGVLLVGRRKARRICPSEMITSDSVLPDVLEALAQSMHGDPSQASQTQLQRFRTAHWYEGEAGADVVSLQRGLIIVPPDDVRPRLLDEVTGTLAEYMAYRQLKTGLFTYQFEPGLDRYTDKNNLVRQIGATIAMSVHAKHSGKSASLAAADMALRYHLKGLTDIPDIDNAAYVATADGRNKLGVTALLCIALAEHPQADGYLEARDKLVNGILWAQRPSGMFVTAFPPAVSIEAQEYFPGEALLALAIEYGRSPSARILDAFDRAVDFYRDYFRNRRSPAFVPWQVQAFALMAHHTKRRDFVDYVFELTDWLAASQLNRSNCKWPELHGGIAPYKPGRAGVSTASYLEAFTDSLQLARTVGDEVRAKRYEEVVRLAARFVMQLQVRPEEAYFVRSRQDAVGGIRTSPAVNRLRIDHCQHALIALIKARRTLYPDEG